MDRRDLLSASENQTAGAKWSQSRAATIFFELLLLEPRTSRNRQGVKEINQEASMGFKIIALLATRLTDSIGHECQVNLRTFAWNGVEFLI